MIRFASLVLAAALFQGNEDAIGKLKAPQALVKAQAAWGKKKGCTLLADVTSSLLSAETGAEERAEYAGKLIRDFVVLKGSAEIYGRGAEKLVRKDNAFVEPRRTEGKLNRLSVLARNPALVAAELYRFAGGAVFVSDEKVGALECRVVDTAADEKSVLDQIKEVSGGLKSLEAYFIKDLSAIADRKQSTSKYRAWLSRTTLLPAKLEWTLTIVVNKKTIPSDEVIVPDQFEIRYEFQFPKYDADLDIEVPPAVRQKFGAP